MIVTASEKNLVLGDREIPYTLVSVVLDENKVLRPTDLEQLEYPKVNSENGVVIHVRVPTWSLMGEVMSPRIPAWLFCTVSQNYHFAPWCAIHDPKWGAVVYATRSKTVKIGDILPSI